MGLRYSHSVISDFNLGSLVFFNPAARQGNPPIDGEQQYMQISLLKLYQSIAVFSDTPIFTRVGDNF